MSSPPNLPATTHLSFTTTQTNTFPLQTDPSSSLLPPAYTSSPSTTLLLSFSWKKLHVLVQETHTPSTPLYSISIRTTIGPHILLRTFPDGTTIGTSTLHLFSITPDISIHGHAGRLHALKRFQSSYSYLSHAYSDTPNQPVTLQWRSASGFVAWDFVCVDGEGNTVARFEASVFNVSKVARVEFMGPKAEVREVREEVLLVGMTVYYSAVSRTYNVFNIFGSVFLRPGPERSELRLANEGSAVRRDDKVGEEERYGPRLNVIREA